MDSEDAQLRQDARTIAEYFKETAVDEILPDGRRQRRLGAVDPEKIMALMQPPLNRIFQKSAANAYRKATNQWSARIFYLAALPLGLAYSQRADASLFLAMMIGPMLYFTIDYSMEGRRKKATLEQLEKENPSFMRWSEMLLRFSSYVRQEMGVRAFRFNGRSSPRDFLGLLPPTTRHYDKSVLAALVQVLAAKRPTSFCGLYLSDGEGS